MKKTLILPLLLVGSALFAGEPFLLKKDNRSDFFKKEPVLPIRKMRANVNGESNIAIKMNLTQLAFKNLSFQGEYGFHPKMSVALGFSFLLQREFPGFFYDSPEGFEENFHTPTYGGWAITPEFRFYPGGKEEKPAPRGFYLAPYFRYAKYTINQLVTYQETPTSKLYSADTKQTYGGYTAGLMIGSQWIIGKHFSLDWWIVGFGYGKAKYSYEWYSAEANLTPKQQEDVKAQAEENFEAFSLFGYSAEVTTTPKSATTTVLGLPMYSLRLMGLCLGYAF